MLENYNLNLLGEDKDGEENKEGFFATSALPNTRFQENMEDIIWDLNMDRNSSPEDVRDRLVLESERMTHAQEA